MEREVELEQALVMVDKWLEYKNKGQHEHAKQIKILEQELEDMQYSFDDMKGIYSRTGSLFLSRRVWIDGYGRIAEKVYSLCKSHVS